MLSSASVSMRRTSVPIFFEYSRVISMSFGRKSAGILSQSSFFTTVAPVNTAHGTSSMYFAFSNMRDEYA